MSIPPEAANNTLKVKEGNPEALKLLDEIARCMDHLRFQKTVHYHPPSVLDVPVSATSSIPTTIPATMSALIVPPFTPSALPSLPSNTDLDLVTKPVAEPRYLDIVAKPVAEWKQSSHPQVLKNLPPQSSSTSTLEIPPSREQWKALFKAGDSKKRKVDDEDTDGADVIEASKLASASQELMKKKRKLNQNVDNRPTGIIDVKPKTLLTVTTDKVVPPGDEKAFWDADTRPAEWGLDAHIATPCQIKITCVIDSVGVRQRMQVKATTAIVEDDSQRRGNSLVRWLPVPANITDPKPTARDILQGIWDLSKRLDLFATNDHVDALEIRVCSVKNILHQQLYALEQCLNASDAQ
ncbi:hypothetical protein BDR06DRAFT_969481 [Suillus hirtellus]|nr:hypothetical protein BDR06DRAFT_969481 [Suillus hirtellus]